VSAPTLKWWQEPVLGGVMAGVIVYRARAAWAPFTTHGRRRGVYWLRGWGRGEQAENRDDY